ncbi:MAG: DNA primase [Anaerolineaceae bacterium]
MTAIDEIKSRIDIVDLVSESVKLRRSGKSYTGFCPFHQNTKTPAFAVFPESGTWRCFGQCNEGGDIFKYVMKKEGWDFTEALKYLAQRAGVTLVPQTPERQAAEEEYARLRTLLEEAAEYFAYHLVQDPAGKPALEYLTQRGVNPSSIETFRLGYAPAGYEGLLGHFSAKGYSSDEMAQVGLVNERDTGGYYDKFRNRIMFPIRDAAGKMAGFGARILDPNDVPKFLNSPQTVLFDKSHLLYGLDQARKAIRTEDQVVIVEGYLDVIALHQCGFSNTVSPMGTALNEDQLRMLKKYTRRMVLALDADAAGEKATLRGLELARQALDRTDEMGFDAHGLLRREARLQADVRVTTLPEGADPDDVVLADPQKWRDILTAAQPIVVHVMETLAKEKDLDDPKTKSAIAAQVLPLIEDVPSPVERDAYRQRLARLLKVDERSLLGSQRVVQRGPRRISRISRPAAEPVRPAQEKTSDLLTHKVEAHLLNLFLQQPEIIYQVNRALQSAMLAPFSVSDFDNSDHVMIASLAFEGLAQDTQDPAEYIKSELPETLAERYQQLSHQEIPVSRIPEERLIDDLVRTVIHLRQIRTREALNQLRFMEEETDPAGEERKAIQEQILQLTLLRGKLDQAMVKPVISS